MDDFSITCRLTSKEYTKVMLIGLYKKPVFILTSIFGFFYLSLLTYGYYNPTDYSDETSVTEFLLGLFILSAPILITTIAGIQFNSNQSFKNDIKYTFGENGMRMEGTTFKGEFTWNHIIKQKEINKFLILYHSKKMGNFIDSTKLTPEQLTYLKSKVDN